MQADEDSENNIFIERQMKKDYKKLRHPNWDLERKFPKNICLEAEIRNATLERNRKRDWQSKIEVFSLDNDLFLHSQTLNGISKDYFLKRFLEYRPILNTDRKNCRTLLTKHCDKIHPENVLHSTFFQSVNSLNIICSIFTTLEWSVAANEWQLDNAYQFWDNVASCLSLKDHTILFELCIAIAFLMYKLPRQPSESMLKILQSLALITYDCCEEFNEYISNQKPKLNTFKTYREADRDSSVPLRLCDTDFMLLSASVYCQVFLINYNFTEDILLQLIDIYVDMPIMERSIYLDLLTVIVTKIKKDSEISEKCVETVEIAERLLDRLLILSPDVIFSNRRRFMLMINELKNFVFAKVPNYAVKVKKQMSLQENMFILSKKTRNLQTISEVISTLFPD